MIYIALPKLLKTRVVDTFKPQRCMFNFVPYFCILHKTNKHS